MPLVLLLLLASCAVNPNSPIEALARQDVANGRNVGALGGAAIGAVVGQNTKLGRENGMRLGYIVGSFTGQQIGQIVATRRLQYDSEKAYIEAEIAATQRAISSKSQQIRSLREKMNQTRRDISELERKHRSNQDVTAEANRKVSVLDGIIANNEASLSKFKDTINYLDEAIATSRKRPDKTPGLEAERNNLIAKKDEVQSQFRSLQNINEDAKSARSRARALSRSERSSSGNNSGAMGDSIKNFIPNDLSRFVPNF